MSPLNNVSIVDLESTERGEADQTRGQPARDDFLDGRQEGLYEACLIVDKIAAGHGQHDLVAEALDAMRLLIRESIHTTDPESIRERVNALANAAATRG